MNQDQMKPLNRFFVFIYYLVGLIADILHPVTVEGLERLPRSGALLCPNHASDWDPILVALKLPVNYRLHIMAKEELCPGSEEEVEMRATVLVAIQTIQQLFREQQRSIEAYRVDWFLWSYGEARLAELPPHHRTRTIFY